MAATATSTGASMEHTPPAMMDPPSYYAPPPSLAIDPTQRSVHFQSPPADPPRDAPDNHSLLPPYTLRQKDHYKGHKSEEEYLTALRAWAEEKTLMQPGEKSQLVGFYGRETMVECIAKNPKLRDKARKEGRKRRGGEECQGAEGGQEGRRRSSIGEWWSRKRMD